MAVVTDAYLWRPEDYAATLSRHVRGADQVDYVALRDAALRAYDAHELVQQLALDSGGWDRRSLLEQWPAQTVQGPESIAVWLLLLAYAGLWPARGGAGQDGQWTWVIESARFLPWPQRDRELLSKGRPFEDFAAAWATQLAAAHLPGEVWRALRPEAVGGAAGWLAAADVVALLARLDADKIALQRVSEHTGVAQAGRGFEIAVTVLRSAMTDGAGVFILTSG